MASSQTDLEVQYFYNVDEKRGYNYFDCKTLSRLYYVPEVNTSTHTGFSKDHPRVSGSRNLYATRERGARGQVSAAAGSSAIGVARRRAIEVSSKELLK